jgi:hypothetical protein
VPSVAVSASGFEAAALTDRLATLGSGSHSARPVQLRVVRDPATQSGALHALNLKTFPRSVTGRVDAACQTDNVCSTLIAEEGLGVTQASTARGPRLCTRM